MSVSTKISDLQSRLESLLERIKEDRLNSDDLACREKVSMDGDPAWVDSMIDGRSIHDDDYHIFRSLDPSLGTVLDIGANWGYSVGSIRASGCELPIVSFEIIPEYESCLRAVKKKLGSNFDYVICGVGSESTNLTLYVPVLNGKAVSALSTASVSQHNQWMLRNLIEYAGNYMDDAEVYVPQIYRLLVKVDTLDNLLRREVLAVSTERIAAIKIDVEGLEGEVLKGAVSTLKLHKPMLLIEGGSRNSDVCRELEAHNYCAAIRCGDSISLIDGMDAGTSNGIFVHKDMISTYSENQFLT